MPTGTGTTVDPRQARASYETAAVLGCTPAMYALAHCCADGLGGAADSTEALNWYCRAGALGHRKAHVMAQILLSRIATVPFPRQQLQALAKQGDPQAGFELAVCRQQGIGMAPNPRAAFLGYLQAAKQGVIRAPGAVGRCYEQGIGVEPDREAAARWYGRGQARGDTALMLALAQRCLKGTARLTGTGICLTPPETPGTADNDGAAYLLRLAADLGSTDAADRLSKA